MQWIRQWTAGTVVACALAAGVSGCGGESSDGDSNDTGSDGTSGGSGGSNSGSGDNGTSSGDNNASSGNGTGGLVTGTPTPVEDYFGEAAAVICEWLTPCCGGLGLPVTEAGCSTVIESQFAADYASADPDNYTYDPGLAGDCLATARVLYADLGCQLEDTAGEIDPSADAACESVFAGKLEPGAPCVADIECASLAGDERDCTTLDSDATVCVIERRAAEGEPCYWTCTETSSGGYVCSGAGSETPALQGRCYTNDQLYCSDGACARQPALGESCAANAVCGEGYCLNDICVAAGDSGDPCQVDSECNAALYCDGTACAPKKPDGEACEYSNECQSESCDADSGTCGAAFGSDFAIALLCALASGQQ